MPKTALFSFLIFLFFGFLVKAQTISPTGGVVYVKQNGSGNGSSWGSATNNLQAAIDAPSVQKVFVERGTYYSTDRGFKMKNNVAIYGGFDSNSGIDDLSDARILPDPNILQGTILHGNNERGVINNNSLSDNQMNNTAVLDGFTITGGNNGFGGGIANTMSSPTFNNLVIKGNSASYGGGVSNSYSSPVYTNVVIKENSAGSDGTAMHNSSASPVLNNALLIHNGTLKTVVYQQSGTAVFNNATVIGYSGGTVGSYSVYIASGASISFNNSIVAGGLGMSNNNYTANYSLIHGNTNTSNGNMNAAGIPLTTVFANPATGVYSLIGNSPAIGMGSNALYAGLNGNTKDLAGNPRLYGVSIDMGAYEFSYRADANGIVYVKPNAIGDGSGWDNATGDLQGAIDAPGTQQVFVAKGTYTVGANSYIMKNGVAVYGGFDPDNGINDLSDSRILPGTGNRGSILSGNNERPIIWNANNGVGSSAVLDGFTLTEAKGSNQGSIYNTGVTPTLRNLLITANITAGIYNINASPVLTNVSITGNTGMGLYQNGGTSVLNNVTIAGNVGYSVTIIPTVSPAVSAVTARNSIICGPVIGGSITNQSSLIRLDSHIPTGIFVNPASGDYTLSGSSSAVNAGNNAFFAGLGASSKDLAGNPRLFDTTIDQGAYEFRIVPSANHIVYVKPASTGTGDGSSWANATGSLQLAINAPSTQQAFVAKGTYAVGASSYILKNGVAVYGGFDPDYGISDLSHNRILPGAGGGSVLSGNNERPVIFNSFSLGIEMNNTAVLDGFTLTGGKGFNQGSIYNQYASPTLRNLLITSNETAGIFNSLSSPVLTNVAIIKNSGNGLHQIGGTIELNNVTIAGNSLPVLVQLATSVMPNVLGLVNAKNSIVYGGITGNFTNQNSLTQESGTFTANQVFADPAGGDYTLLLGSPAINAGNNALYTGLSTTLKDLAGKSRLVGDKIDLGAYEYGYLALPDANGIIYVRTSPTGNGMGTSWENATGNLQHAIDGPGIHKVFVATGEYNVGTSSFIMRNDVAIYGGFDPDNGIKTLDDTRVLPTQSSAQASVLNGKGARPSIWNENVGLTPSAILDGFVITGGQSVYGGGIYNKYGSPTFNNLLITDNQATYGAGVYNGYGSPAFNNCIIKGNRSGYYGGGIYNDNSSSVFTNVLIVENSANTNGGAIFNENNSGNPALINVTIANNTSAFAIHTYIPFSIKNSIVYGGINELGATYTAQNSLIEGKTSTANGNLNATGITLAQIFANPAASDYKLLASSPAINKGNNSLFAGLDANTKDLAGNLRFRNTAIDLGAYENDIVLAPTAGVIYVNADAQGTQDGSSWENATSDLHNAIHKIGAQKVFVAVGEYKVGDRSFAMKDGVEIYGGFDPENGIRDLSHNRILPTVGSSVVEGSILNGENARTVISNTFTEETAMTNAAILDGFTVKNGSNLTGAGFYNSYASPTLRNLVIKDNSTYGNSYGGGGMYNTFSSPILYNVNFSNNYAEVSGGGMLNQYSSPELNNVSFINNTARHFGGGIYNRYDAHAVLTNVLLIGNRGDVEGGAIKSDGRSTLTLTNVTITGNTTGGTVGGIHDATGFLLTLQNSIVYGNTVTGSGTGNPNLYQTAGASNIRYNNLVEGFTNTTENNLDATGITLADIFTNPSGGDYTLKENSPAIDAGEDGLYAGLDENTKDLAGNSRIYDFGGGGTIDLGAYESSYRAYPYYTLIPTGGIIYVKETASGLKNGSSWGNATNNLKRAIRIAGVQQVFTAIGNYPTSNIAMKNNVAVYGGFDPDNGIDDLTDTRILPNPDANIESSVLNGRNTQAVVWNKNNGLNSTAILDGFTLANGLSSTGGGIYNNGASPTLSNLWIKENTAKADGGGMYNINSSSPVLTNVTVSNNTASYAGGIFNRNNSSPVMTNVSIKANTSANDGGGMYNDVSASPVLTNVSITGNAAQNGAGMYNRNNSSPILVNTLLANNTATANGGAIRNEISSSPLLTNVTIANNTSSNTLYATDGSTSLANSIIYGSITGSYTAQNSLIEGKTSTANGNLNATGITLAQLFANPALGDYTLLKGSPVINKGDNSLFAGLDANSKDLDGKPRFVEPKIDLGAYEFESIAVPDANGIVYVRETSTGNGRGTDWNNATNKLQEAIDAADVQKVFVAVGNYGAPASSFVMKNNVAIYGGFDPANGITDLSHSRILANKNMGDGSVLDAQNVGHVIYNNFTSATALANTAVLDGFTITRGKAADGGGIYNNYASPILNNLVFKENTATANGGAIRNSNSAPSISNSIFKNNSANRGGAIFNGISSAPIVISYVTITGNTAFQGGGILNENADTVTLINIKLKNNTVSGSGSAMYSFTSSTTVSNAEVTGNTGNHSIVQNNPGNTTLNNVTIANNGTSAMNNQNGGTVNINNAIVFGTLNGTDYTKQYSFIQGNTDTSTGNINTTGITVNDVFTNPSSDDYTLKQNSPAINKGSNALYAGLNANSKDLRENPRLVGTAIDLGAYESPIVLAHTEGIIYVNADAQGIQDGSSWENATADLHNAIHIDGVQKVFVAVGEYKVGSNSLVMKNNVEIYGGFDPENGIRNLSHNRILPAVTPSVIEGSILNGENAKPVISNVFTSATAMNNTAVLDGFTIKNGYTTGSTYGGGISNTYASPTLRNLVVKNNKGDYGGGLSTSYGSPIVTDCIFTGNVAVYSGGGILNSSNSGTLAVPVFTNCIIMGNSAGAGGGISNSWVSATFINCAVTGNTATSNTGIGGVYIYSSGSTVFTNSTIANNSGNNSYLSTGSSTLQNSIVWDKVSASGSYNASHSLIKDKNDTSNGNIDATGLVADDIFTNPLGGDYTLKENSPAIDAGEENLYEGLVENTKDLAGNARIYDFNGGGTPDLGAYESSYITYPYVTLTPTSGIIYVKETASGLKNGSSWDNATNNLKRAIRIAGVQQVWAAIGNYPASYISMKNNVAVYGGFDPDNGIDDLADTRILPNPDANIGGSVMNGLNLQPVVWNNNNGLDNTAILDGFTLTNGRSTTGGGVYNHGASPKLSNLWIKENTATSDGGGMYNINSSSPVMTRVTLANNTATYAGGIFNRNNSSPVMTNVSIKANTSANDGGGMYNDVSTSPVLTNVFITGNVAKNGAGMYNRNNSSPILVNALIANNTATTNGGAIRNEISSSTLLTNVTIANNIGSNTLYATDGSTLLANSIIYGSITGSYTAQNSLIEGKTSTANGNLNATGITLAQVFTNSASGDYTLLAGSPVINKGNNSLFTGVDANSKDLANNARVYKFSESGVIDMGAYEVQETTLTQTINPIADMVKTYGDAAFAPGATATSGLAVSYASADDNIAEVYQDTADGNKWKIKVKKTGTVTITASQAGNGDYPAAVNVDFTLTVNKKAVILAFTTAALSKTYDGTTTTNVNAAHLQFIGGDIINSDDVEVQVGSPGAVYDTKEVGTNKIITLPLAALSLSGDDAVNYQISNTVDLSKFNAKVVKATLTVKANNASKVYDAHPYADGNGVTYTGFVNGETESVLQGTLSYTGTSQAAVMPGTYDIMPGGYSSGNYTINFVPGTLTIAPNSVNTLSFITQAAGTTLNKVFGDAVINATAAASSGLTVSYQSTNPLVATVDGNGQVTFVGVGITDIQALQVGNESYSAAVPIGITVVVSRKALTVIANDAVKTYDGIAYANGNGVTYTGFVNGENESVLQGALSYTGTSQGAKNVGNYVLGISGYSSANYDINYQGADLTIAAKSLGVVADAKGKAYGAADPALAYTVSGLAPGDVLTGSLSRATGEDVGTYAISQGTLSAGSNYTINFTPANFSIGNNVVTIVASAKTKVYGAADPLLTYTASGLAPGDVLTGSLGRATGEDAGTYAITQGSLSSGSNYTISFSGSNLTITPKALGVVADAKSKSYGAADPILTYNVNGLMDGDGLTGNLTRAVGEDAGTYAITQGTLSAGSNYTINFTSANFTIGNNVVTIVATAKTKVYGTADPALTYTVSGLAPGDVLTGSLSRATGEDVGTYAIAQGSLSAGSNYTINFSGSNLTITPKALAIVADAKSKAHGASDPSLTYTVSGLAPGDVLTGSLTRVAGENVGSYAITQGTLSVGSNYTINFTPAMFVIGGQHVTITVNAKTKVYGTTDPLLTYTVSGLAPGDVLTGSLTRTAGEDVGSYAIIRGSLSAGSNYTIDFSGSNLTIIPKAINVVADAKSKAYGTADPLLTYTVSGLAPGDVLAGSLNRATGENVGSYTIAQGTLSAGSNYTINFTPAMFIIGGQQVTVVVNAKTKVYSASDPALTYTVSGLALGDVLTGSLSRATGEDVGVYTISQGTLSAGSNYTINFSGSNLTITPKALGVVADAKSKIYGAADPVLTYTTNGLAFGDVMSGSLSRAIGKDVGTYAISQGTLSAGSNYTINFTPAMFVIGGRQVTITVHAKTKVYGTADPALTYTVSGLAPGDVLTGSLSRAAGEGVGVYTISQGTLSAGSNYTITFTPSTLTIGSQKITVIADAKSKIYGAADPALTYMVSGLIGSDALTGMLQRAGGENAGSYTVNQGTLNAGNNYQLNFQTSTLTINKAVLQVTALNQQVCQGYSLPSLTLSYSGFRNGDTENNLNSKPTVSTAANSNSPSGNYALIPSGGATINYAFDYINGTLTINALPQVNISSSNGNNISKGETLILTASGSTSYVWANANGIVSGQNSAVLTVRPSETTTYTVSATNASGCSMQESYRVEVRDDFQGVVATNLLSPNGDGINDNWVIENIDMYPNNEVKVFDKAGRVVYSKRSYDNSWNGTVNGSPLAENTYYYIIDFGAGKPKQKGFITIVQQK